MLQPVGESAAKFSGLNGFVDIWIVFQIFLFVVGEVGRAIFFAAKFEEMLESTFKVAVGDRLFDIGITFYIERGIKPSDDCPFFFISKFVGVL